MREIMLFVEDFAHQQIIGALLQRFGRDLGIEMHLTWRSARRGHGRVMQEFDEFLRDLAKQGGHLPDMIIVATDANCKGLNERMKELQLPILPPLSCSPFPTRTSNAGFCLMERHSRQYSAGAATHRISSAAAIATRHG